MRWGPLLQVLVLAGAALAAPQLFNPAGHEDLPLDKLAALSDLAKPKDGSPSAQGDAASALLKALKQDRPSTGSRLQSEVLRIAESLRKSYLGFRNKVLAAMIVVGLFTVAVLFLGLVPLVRYIAKSYLTFLYGFCCHWLMWMALAMFAFYAAAHLNPWPIIPKEFFYAPAGCLLLTGMFIRMLDPNYPLWNTLLKGLGSTILSCAGIAGCGFFR
ncbi:MAG: hypothetical protein HZB91_14545 [Elusimicrobia bacterium]|nr:hypothetical protein [Elusimicrobiota bacterium]